MGLDTVGLVMAIEEEFLIEISEAEAERLLTAGDIHDCVVRVLRAHGQSPDPRSVWERVRSVIVRQLGVRPAEVVRSARIIEDLRID